MNMFGNAAFAAHKLGFVCNLLRYKPFSITADRFGLEVRVNFLVQRRSG
jgi:hypothetical protein